MWTQAWRRLNKKGKDDGISRKRVRKVAKVQRAIVGASLEDVSFMIFLSWIKFTVFLFVVIEEEAAHQESCCFRCRHQVSLATE